MINLFNKPGAFSPEELAEFIKLYEKYGRHNWDTTINLGREASPKIQGLVNDLSQSMGRLTDRLALTIVELSKRKLSQHSGDCTVYASLHNGTPEAGVCICGYGLQFMRETGDNSQLYSKELRESLVCNREGI